MAPKILVDLQPLLGEAEAKWRGRRYTRKGRAATRKKRPPARRAPPPSAFFVRSDVAVDEVADVVVVFLLLFQEAVVFDVDFVDRGLGRLFVAGLDLVQRHHVNSGRRRELRILLVLLRGRARARRRSLEDRSAFWADDGILVEIKEFGAAVLTLPFGAEFGFGQCDASLKFNGDFSSPVKWLAPLLSTQFDAVDSRRRR